MLSLSGDHAQLGSPPLAREPPNAAILQFTPPRITPARAGTTPLRHVSAIVKQDHPRSRGNHAFLAIWKTPVTGSPPLAREPPKHTTKVLKLDGITPARAGTTLSDSKPLTLEQDHPRSRGNHLSLRSYSRHNQGSPPLAREPLFPCVHRVVEVRITPARAGTTRSGTVLPSFRGDHPRSRGNHQGGREPQAPG